MGSPDTTPLRRSIRSRKVPVSYSIPDEDQMDDFIVTDFLIQCKQKEQQPEKTSTSCTDSVNIRGHNKRKFSPAAIKNRSMAVIRGGIPSAAIMNPPQSQQNPADSSDDSDGEYGVKPKKKKQKTAHMYEEIVVGGTKEKEEQVLRKICSGLGIRFDLFDGWVEDPRSKDPSKMNIPFMPNEIMIEIFGHCRSEVLVQCEKSCRRFQSILKDNTRIWRQARLHHYPHPGVEAELPFNLDETSLFELAIEKGCDYCESEKARPYYAWGIRSCHECIRSLTMPISEFKKMFKKKCDDEEDWTPYRREQVCNAIHWHKNPNYSKICWKEYAYNLIEEAEDEMLAGNFDEWIKTKQISPKERWKTRPLEAWGSTISKKISEDRRMDEMKVKNLRIAFFHDWCMRLPKPIPQNTLKQLNAYGAFLRNSCYPTKSEFIRQLPKLLKERDLHEEKERRKEYFRALYRIRQYSVLDRVCSDIIQQIIKEGPLSAMGWCAILQKALQQISKAMVEIKLPRGTPLAVLLRPEDWKSDLNSRHLMKLIDLLEDKLFPHLGTGTGEELLHPASYEFFYYGEDRVFACPAAIKTTSPGGCKHKAMMNFRELFSHLFSIHPHGYGSLRSLLTTPHSIVVHPKAKQAAPLSIIGGKQYSQQKLQVWFRPLPEMLGTEYAGGFMRYKGVFRTLLKRRMRSQNSSIMASSGSGAPVMGTPTDNIHGLTGSNDSNGGGSRKSIMMYFRVQKRPAIQE